MKLTKDKHMESIHLTVPSKTFLLGEYVALKGGPSLVLSTEPRFELIATKQWQENLNCPHIHPESPAGKLIKQYTKFFQNYHLQFVDPYESLGGFGASSAQFVSLYALKNYAEGSEINDFEMLKEYKQLAWNGKGMPPSGADIIAQLHGGICFFHLSEKRRQAFKWPFEDLGYCLIHTGHKLATHQHLGEMTDIHVSDLEQIVQQALASIKQTDSQGFIDAINHYASRLQQRGLIAKQTEEKLKQLSHCSDITAAKGCGALGADVILTVFDKQKQKKVLEWLKKHQFHVIAYGNQVAEGLHVL